MSEKVLASDKQIREVVDNMYEAISVARQFIYRLENADMYEEIDMLKRQTTCCFRTLAAISNTVEMLKYQNNDVAPTIFDAGVYLNDVVSNCVPKVRSYGTRITYDCDPEAYVNCNPDRFVNCILNLLANALANTDPEEGTIRITVKKRGDVVAVTVSDDGYGLPRGVDPHDFFNSEMPCGFSVLYKFSNLVGTTPVYESGEYSGFSITVKIPLVTDKGLFANNAIPDLGTVSPINVYLAKIRELNICDIY